MLQILIGYKSTGTAEVLYAGPDAVKLEAARVASHGKGFTRLGKVVNPTTVPVAIPQPEAEKAHALDQERIAKLRVTHEEERQKKITEAHAASVKAQAAQVEAVRASLKKKAKG